MTYGATMVGLWMCNRIEVEAMRSALEGRLRVMGPDDPMRAKLESWRKETMNMQHRAEQEGWVGWQPLPEPPVSANMPE